MTMISVITPILNEKNNLNELITRIANTLKKTEEVFEILIVDDGSSDGSKAKFEEIKKNFIDCNIKYISHENTEGHQKALLTGIKLSKGEYVCTIDGDLQDPPELILEMLKYLKENKDVHLINTVRKKRLGEPIWKILFINLFYSLYNLINKNKIIPNSGDFRICRKKVYEKLFNVYNNEIIFFRININNLGFKTHQIYYNQQKRKMEKAKGNFLWLLDFAIDAFLCSDKKNCKKIFIFHFLIPNFLLANLLLIVSFLQINFDLKLILALCLVGFIVCISFWSVILVLLIINNSLELNKVAKIKEIISESS